MRSVQLRYLDDSAGQILIHLTQLYEILESVNIPFEVDTSGPDIIQIAEQIETDFQASCTLSSSISFLKFPITVALLLNITTPFAAKSLRDDPL
ncbi:hypothetical protein H4Q26_006167 [Puccinia striiformis f. sp. tritici PST-130]|nr:hypothetical protein H4Q26_006167 [Puccinia striiformis f. sp. tritici PST-130]